MDEGRAGGFRIVIAGSVSPDRLTVCGIPASPYTRKLLAVLRYRHIPYRFISVEAAEQAGLPIPKVRLIPMLYGLGQDGEIVVETDTSPIIRALEISHAGRAVVPSDPALALLDMLLEDYGDEWLTKAMFHYRWTYDADIERNKDMLPFWFMPLRPDDETRSHGEAFGDRQIERLRVVGSNPLTRPLIEASYHRFLGITRRHFAEHPFLLGRRPGAGDFAIFGQLTQLAAFDPTPMALTLEVAPRLYAWTSLAEDLSGIDPRLDDWFGTDALPDAIRDLLSEVGRTYVPVMLANARATVAGDREFSVRIEGARWQQRTFPYQAKCVRWLREAYARLEASDREAFDRAIAGTGCEDLFAGA